MGHAAAMIVSASEAGTLELYWRHPVSKHPNREKAASFLSRCCRPADVEQAWKKVGQGTAARFAIEERLADAIATGRFVVLQYRSESRWPGTRLPAEPISSSALLMVRARTHCERNVQTAVRWLQEAFRPDDAEMLWKVLWVQYGKASIADQPPFRDFVADAVRLVESGELVPLFHPLPVLVKTVIRSDQAGLPEGLSPRPSPPPPDPDTFSPDHGIEAQIENLRSAAESGVPFCEVCERAARAAAAQSAAPPQPEESPVAVEEEDLAPPESEKKLYWIEIELIGEDGKPIPGEAYSVKLPDGQLVTGSLDSDGLARIDGIESAGACEVTFPNLDSEAWEVAARA